MNDYEHLRKVVDELKFLRDSGYDGPFMGEAIEPLMLAFHAWESSTLPAKPFEPEETCICGSNQGCIRDQEEQCYGPVRWYGQWVCDDHARDWADPASCPKCGIHDTRPFHVVGRCIRTKEELQALPIGTKLACEEDPSADCDLCHSRFDAFFTKLSSTRWKRDDGQITPTLGLEHAEYGCLGRLYIVTEEAP